MKTLWLLCIILALVSAAPSETSPKEGPVRFDGYSVYKLIIESKLQLSVVDNLQNLTEKYNIWKEYDEDSKEVHIMVAPVEVEAFSSLMNLYGVEYSLLINDVQKLIDEERAYDSATSDDNTFGWKRYYQLHEIENWLDGILAKYPGITEGFTIGKSYEGRSIRGIKISRKSGNPGIFIESNIHAREWITSATATWFINQLLIAEDPRAKELSENYDWYIIPVFNVDGFVYSHETNRMWRKTRKPLLTSACVGADANRNFDSHWMANNGASNNPCSETFAGSAAFSEPETKALADYVSSIKNKINIYISFHSYGQFLLSPYGHTAEQTPENYNHLLEIGAAFSDAVKVKYGTEYQYGSTAKVLYVASGTSVDWVFNTLDVKVGFTIEYRDKGRYGFVLPPVQIIPNCEELIAGMSALVKKSNDLGYLKPK